jgi:prepilin-type processing-associated H-X9-DG protein
VQQCPNCEKKISRAAATKCPHCGTRLGHTPPLSDSRENRNFSKITGLRLSVIGIVLVIVLVGVFLSVREVPFLHPTLGLLILSLAFIIPALGILSLVVSAYELIKLTKSAEQSARKGSTITGLFLGIFIIIFCAFLPYLIMTIGRERHVDPACKNNLKQLGLILNMYANENKVRFPPIDDSKNNFMFEGDVMHPEYLYDVSILACPDNPNHDPSAGQVNPDCLSDESYIYLGWMVTTDEEAKAFFEVYDTLSPEAFDQYLTVAKGKGNGGGSILNRLSQNVDLFLTPVTDITSGSGPSYAELVPIIWDRPFTDPSRFRHHHEETGDPGGYVLYLDGHVEFVKYGEKFPMTETMARLLEERPREFIADCEESNNDQES